MFLRRVWRQAVPRGVEFPQTYYGFALNELASRPLQPTSHNHMLGTPCPCNRVHRLRVTILALVEHLELPEARHDNDDAGARRPHTARAIEHVIHPRQNTIWRVPRLVPRLVPLPRSMPRPMAELYRIVRRTAFRVAVVVVTLVELFPLKVPLPRGKQVRRIIGGQLRTAQT